MWYWGVYMLVRTSKKKIGKLKKNKPLWGSRHMFELFDFIPENSF